MSIALNGAPQLPLPIAEARFAAEPVADLPLSLDTIINMGWRWRKSFKNGPIRWTLSRRGVGWSVGIPGIRYGRSPTGEPYISVGVPGTGLYWLKYFGRKSVSGGSKTVLGPQPQGQINQLPPSVPGVRLTANQRLLFWKQKP